jgi:hypothetical protein
VLQASCSEVADLVLWRHLIDACQVPGATVTPDGLSLAAYMLLMTGQREIKVGAGAEWQQAALAAKPGALSPGTRPGADEVLAYVAGGLLAGDSSPVLLRFASPDIQAIMAGLFLAREPGRRAHHGRIGQRRRVRSCVADGGIVVAP